MSSTDELSRLLAAERDAAVPAGSAETGLPRLLDALAAPAPALPTAAGSLKLGLSLVGKWVGLGFCVGIAVAGAGFYATAPQLALVSSPAPLGSVARAKESPVIPSEGPRRPSEMANDEVAANLPQKASSKPQTVPTPRTAITPRDESALRASPTLDEELRLLAAAKRELDAGRAHLARGWLSEHRARFPGGALSLEREGLDALARCSVSPSTAVAHDFAVRHPQSPMLRQVERRCGETPSGFSEPDK